MVLVGAAGAGKSHWAAEDAGFTGLALMDHLVQVPQVGRAREPIPEPLVTLGVLAASTTRLRLGTLVSPVTFRPPGVLAKAMATLDVLTSGRGFCGIGAGWFEREHASHGVAFPPIGARQDALGDLAGRGVSTVFLAMDDLDGPDDVARLAPLADALPGRR